MAQCSGILVLGGVEAVTMSNNHTRDFGDAGLRDTEAALAEYGVAGIPGNQGQCFELRHPSMRFSNFTVALMAASVWSASRPRVRYTFPFQFHVMTACTKASVRPPGGILTL